MVSVGSGRDESTVSGNRMFFSKSDGSKVCRDRKSFKVKVPNLV